MGKPKLESEEEKRIEEFIVACIPHIDKWNEKEVNFEVSRAKFVLKRNDDEAVLSINIGDKEEPSSMMVLRVYFDVIKQVFMAKNQSLPSLTEFQMSVEDFKAILENFDGSNVSSNPGSEKCRHGNALACGLCNAEAAPKCKHGNPFACGLCLADGA